MKILLTKWINSEPNEKDIIFLTVKRLCLLILVALFVQLWLHTDACGGK